MSPLPFQPFTPKSTVTSRTKSNLPHWTCPGATHFLTFRLHDSIPANLQESWNRKRREWLKNHGANPDQSSPAQALNPQHRREYRRLFGKAYEEALDRGQGQCLLAKKENAQLLEGALRHFDGERYQLGDFVIMPNHVHLLVIPREGFTIGAIAKSWKGFSAREINRREERSGSLWQPEIFDHIVRNQRQLLRLVNYIRENPEKSRLSPEACLRFEAEWSFENSTVK